MLDIMKKRSQQDEDMQVPTRNRLPADAIYALLEARKDIKTSKELEILCKNFNVDLNELNELGKYVNTPTVQKIPSEPDEEGELFLVCFSLLMGIC